MHDIVTGKGDRIDIERLAEKIDAPVVATVATKGSGMKELKKAILDAIPEKMQEAMKKDTYKSEHLPGDVNGGDHLHYHPKHHHHGEYEKLRPPAIKYRTGIERKLKEIVLMLESEELLERFPPRWIALKLLERDQELLSMLDEDLKRKVLEVSL